MNAGAVGTAFDRYSSKRAMSIQDFIANIQSVYGIPAQGWTCEDSGNSFKYQDNFIAIGYYFYLQLWQIKSRFVNDSSLTLAYSRFVAGENPRSQDLWKGLEDAYE